MMRIWDQESGLQAWQAILDHAKTLPPVLAVVVVDEARRELETVQGQGWQAGLLAADLLRARGKTRAHVFCFDQGYSALPVGRRRNPDRRCRVLAGLEGVALAA